MGATDGTIGKVDDVYFDDEHWAVRYLVVDTGHWLEGRRVLISPIAVGHPDWNGRLLPVSLTRTQIEKSPGVDTRKPVRASMRASTSDTTGIRRTGEAPGCGAWAHIRAAPHSRTASLPT